MLRKRISKHWKF